MTFSNVILVLVAAAGLLLAQGLYYLVVFFGQQRRTELRRRLQALAKPGAEHLSLTRERRIARTPGLDRLLRTIPAARQLERLLLQTDLTWTVAMVVAFSVVLAGGLTIALLFLLRRTPFLATVGIPIGLAVPFLYVLNARIHRSVKMSSQLPDALEMMVRSLRAGHGLNNGFKLVAQEMPTPVAVEFGRCFEEQQFGVSFREAVEHMTERVPNNLDLRIFAVSIVIQQETGGNLVEILEKIADTIRERFKFYGKLRALTAEGKISGYILGALPFACLAFVALLNPTYLVPLAADPAGRLIGLGGLGLWIFGVLWMSRMVKVDY